MAPGTAEGLGLGQHVPFLLYPRPPPSAEELFFRQLFTSMARADEVMRGERRTFEERSQVGVATV